jgi:hypothetical protein
LEAVLEAVLGLGWRAVDALFSWVLFSWVLDGDGGDPAGVMIIAA